MSTKYNLEWLFDDIKTEFDEAKFVREKNIIYHSKKAKA